MECSKKMNHDLFKRYPINGTFELTVRCNLDCKMCLFRHADEENPILRRNELTTEQWIDMARQVAQAGCMNLLITGGEPMLREDFCEIWEGIYKQGFIIELYTNATLVNDKIMNTLRKYPPHKIGITLYGASNEIYEKTCGHKNGFDLALQGIKKLQTLPSTIKYRTTIIKDNYPDIENIYALVASFGVDPMNLTQTRIVTQSVRGAKADVNTCRLDAKDNLYLAYRRGISYIKNQVGENFDPRNLHLEYLEDQESCRVSGRPTLLGCEAGMNQFTISYDGKLLGCQMLGIFHTDAVHSNFIKAWNDYPNTVMIPMVHTKCENCDLIRFCNACVASRYAESGDVNGIPEYVCKDCKETKNLIDGGGFGV